MQQILNVITPSATQDLVTLTEMKMKLQVPPGNTTNDALIQEIITNMSETVARLCNRVFGYEEVDELFFQLEDETTPATRRLYLSRWPVAAGDIQSCTCDGIDISKDNTWILEQSTGTMYRPPAGGPWYGQIEVVYSGGYQLPDDAPASLKYAVEAVIREAYGSWIRDPALYMVQSLSHKEARVHYFGPNMFSAAGLPATWTQLENVLYHYSRQWV